MDGYHHKLTTYLALRHSASRSTDLQGARDIAEQMVQRYLVDVHPRLLSNVRCGITILPGWIPLVGQLCFELEKFLSEHPHVTISVDQVKEKFGTLRFYISTESADEPTREMIHTIIDGAEGKSGLICEYCGQPGAPRYTRWIKTVCSRHEKL